MNKTNECLGCCEPKNLIELECYHKHFCLECCNKILTHDPKKKLKCPMCRKPTYNTSDKDINNKILVNELIRQDDDVSDNDDVLYIDDYTIHYIICYYIINNYKLIKPKPISYSYKVFKRLKIRNKNVVKITYL